MIQTEEIYRAGDDMTTLLASSISQKDGITEAEVKDCVTKNIIAKGGNLDFSTNCVF